MQSPHQLESSDVDELRACGLDDAEIFDIVVWAWFCTFWSGVHDVIGYEPPTGWVSKTRSLLGVGLCETLNAGPPFVTHQAHHA